MGAFNFSYYYVFVDKKMFCFFFSWGAEVAWSSINYVPHTVQLFFYIKLIILTPTLRDTAFLGKYSKKYSSNCNLTHSLRLNLGHHQAAPAYIQNGIRIFTEAFKVHKHTYSQS